MTMRRHFDVPDGTRLGYRDLGAGLPLVLFPGDDLPGDSSGADGTGWPRHAEALVARGHRVILPDLRAPGPVDVLAADGLALLAHLALTRYDLGGHRLGAQVVVQMIARGALPDRVVLVGEGIGTTPREEPRWARTPVLVLTAADEKGPVPDEATAGLHLTVPGFSSPEVVSAITGFFRAHPPRQ